MGLTMDHFSYNDGGRAAAGFKGRSRDCVVRAIAIAAELPYAQVYKDLGTIAKSTQRRKGRNGEDRNKHFTPAQGLDKRVYEPYLFKLGWCWEPCMEIGSGCKIHLRARELPAGRIIASVSKHLVAVIDGVIHDNHDCSRGGTRCVYGFYFQTNWRLVMSDITYTRLSGGATAVYVNDGLRDRRAGTIVTLPGKGFQYKNGLSKGEIFRTIDEVKQSLEGGE